MLKKLILILICVSFCAVADTKKNTTDTKKNTTPKTSPAVTKKKEVKMTAAEQKLQKDMTQLFELSKDVNATNKKQRAKARRAVEGSLSWYRVAYACLGKRVWNKQAGKNRGTFQALLKDVIVFSAYSRLDKFWKDVDSWKLTKVKIKGKKAEASADFELDDEIFQLDYYFIKKGKKWLIEDLAYEEMRYGENIYEQISAFLKENKFPQLLTRLRRRRADLIADARDEEKAKKAKTTKKPKKG